MLNRSGRHVKMEASMSSDRLTCATAASFCLHINQLAVVPRTASPPPNLVVHHSSTAHHGRSRSRSNLLCPNNTNTHTHSQLWSFVTHFIASSPPASDIGIASVPLQCLSKTHVFPLLYRVATAGRPSSHRPTIDERSGRITEGFEVRFCLSALSYR